jgi:hypothetical protein
MKLNFKKIRLNQLVLFIAIIIVIVWIVRKSRSRVERMGAIQESPALLYIQNSENPVPFVLYGMVQKETDDEEFQKKALTLATQKKFVELEELLKTL